MHKATDATNNLEAIFNTIQVPMLVLDQNAQVLRANRMYYIVFQITEAETIGKRFHMLGNGEWDDKRLRHAFKDITEKGSWFQDFYIEHDFHTIGRRIMKLDARKIIQSRNTDPEILVTISDVTTQRTIERGKDGFVAFAAHEVISPLSQMMLFAHNLEIYLLKNDDQEARNLATMIDENLGRLNRLILTLVDMSKASFQHLQLHKSKFPIDVLVEEVVANFRQVQIHHTFVQKGDRDVRVFADRERVFEVLLNIISNAVKYSPQDSTITVTVKATTTKVTVSIKDEGIGIPELEQGSVFKRFFRSSNASPFVHGMGLGLFISSEIIAQHKGNIRVVSKLGKGSTFSFELALSTD